MTRTLVATAMGREKADLVVKDGNLVNVYTRELLEGVDVAVKGDRIALVGEAGHTVGLNTVTIDAKGRYLAPGFLDGHVHVESSMVTVTQFAKVVLLHGTTGAFIDPHEIANVLGLRGVELMLEESKGLPLKVFVSVPSCVPASSPEFETAGAEMGPKEVEEALKWDSVVALGEVMNYPGVIGGDGKMHGEIEAALRSGKVVEGHSDSILDKELAAYASAGITSCHESTRKVDGLQRARLGVYTMVREGSAWRDLAEVIRIVTEGGIDPRRVCLVTDDRHPKDLFEEGGVDHVVRRAIREGVDPLVAVQMATLNTAEHFNVDLNVGGIAPSRFADILILDGLTDVSVNTVIADGRVVAKEGRLIVDLKPPRYPDYAKKTVRVKRPLEPGDLVVRAPMETGTVRAHVIGVSEGKIVTKHLMEGLPVRAGATQASSQQDIVKAAVVERHKLTGNIGLGFVKGFGFKSGAVASTVAHDSHNLLVMGTNDEDMVLAANELVRIGGGMIAVKDGEVIALVELPIAGLMSPEEIQVVSEKMKGLESAWVDLGCDMASPFMTMSFLSLSVLPELRVTDKGLIDTVEFKKIGVLAD